MTSEYGREYRFPSFELPTRLVVFLVLARVRTGAPHKERGAFLHKGSWPRRSVCVRKRMANER